MVKVELVEVSEGVSQLVFEVRDQSADSIAELDKVYALIMGSNPRLGGYLNSSSFEVKFNLKLD